MSDSREQNPGEQLEFFDIPSPCIRRCETDSKGYCLGCFRSRDERFNWLKYTPAQQRMVLKLCQQRKYRRALALQKAKEAAEAHDGETLSLFDDEPQPATESAAAKPVTGTK